MKPQPATLLKKRLWHRCFSANFAKFLRKAFFTEHLGRLLLLCLKWNDVVVVFFETNVLKEVNISRDLHNNNAMLIPNFQNKCAICNTC